MDRIAFAAALNITVAELDALEAEGQAFIDATNAKMDEHERTPRKIVHMHEA